ncbi:MAG: TetR/AcrR family transcriptional regulator [candidate division Zixibacteria bacterium]|nr:TetR/AcrR family transcriptional regulator [candidate division Zixibacteria bacterium]
MHIESTERKIPKENKKVKAIIGAGQALFAQFGYKKTTVDEIARTAKVAKGTMYKYFQSKDDIFAEVVHREGNHITELIEEAVAREKNPSNKIRALILVKIREIKKAVSFYKVTREVAHELWPIMNTVRSDFYDWECELITKILYEGIGTGQFKINRVEMVATIIATVLKALELEWVLEREPSELEAEVDLLMDIILWGITGKA